MPSKRAKKQKLTAYGSLARIEEIAKLNNIATMREFEQLLNIPIGALAAIKHRQKTNPTTSISIEIAEKILSTFHSINPRWLLFGEGNMLEQGALKLTDADRAMFEALKERIRRLSVFVGEIEEIADLMTKV